MNDGTDPDTDSDPDPDVHCGTLPLAEQAKATGF